MSQFATEYRTHTCGELRGENAGEKTTLAGFVDRKVEEASFLLRDGHGKSLVVADATVGPELQGQVEDLPLGAVIRIEGEVATRGQSDGDLPTGEIHVVPASLEVLSHAEPMPPDLEEEEIGSPDRIQCRHLDLRREEMQERLRFRALFLLELRSYLISQGFSEVETPLLTRWSTDDTASYLVPTAANLVYALPGTPQLYKQLLIVGGCERYFQVARCFRKEEKLTPDRQPEYNVLDVEMAYVDEEDVLDLVDGLMAHIWKSVLGRERSGPIPRLTYEEVMLRFGTDRPDLRFGLEIRAMTEALSACAPFKEVLAEGGVGRALRVPGASSKLDDAFLDELGTRFEEIADYKLVWLRVGEGGAVAGPEAEQLDSGVAEELQAERDDVVLLIGAAHRSGAERVAGAVRSLLGQELGLIDRDRNELVWVYRFPFFEFDADAESWAACRHPFTRPLDEHMGLLDDEEKKHTVLTKSYDLVLNGHELGAGSIRNHELDLQRRIFKMFEYEDDEVERRFGAVLGAFRYGAPPHGGLAVGLDRFLAQLQGSDAIADVIAFPKATDCTDPLAGSPSQLDEELVDEMFRDVEEDDPSELEEDVPPDIPDEVEEAAFP
ncbi:aspartate--tRNA ligase [Planctomycetota bacterium]